MSTAWTTVKIAVFAPMPRASVAIVTAAKPGFFASERAAKRRSCQARSKNGRRRRSRTASFVTSRPPSLRDALPPRFLRRHSAAHGVVDVHLDVRLELLGHVPLLASPPEEAGEPGEEPAHAPHARPSAGARKQARIAVVRSHSRVSSSTWRRPARVSR